MIYDPFFEKHGINAVVVPRAKGCDNQIGADMLFEQIPAYIEFIGLGPTTPDQLRDVRADPPCELIAKPDKRCPLVVDRAGMRGPSRRFSLLSVDKPFISGSNPATKNWPLTARNNADARESKTGAAKWKRTGASHGDFAS